MYIILYFTYISKTQDTHLSTSKKSQPLTLKNRVKLSSPKIRTQINPKTPNKARKHLTEFSKHKKQTVKLSSPNPAIFYFHKNII